MSLELMLIEGSLKSIPGPIESKPVKSRLVVSWPPFAVPKNSNLQFHNQNRRHHTWNMRLIQCFMQYTSRRGMHLTNHKKFLLKQKCSPIEFTKISNPLKSASIHNKLRLQRLLLLSTEIKSYVTNENKGWRKTKREVLLIKILIQKIEQFCFSLVARKFKVQLIANSVAYNNDYHPKNRSI